MIIRVENTYYCVNVSKFKGSEQIVANKVVSEIMSRMDLKSASRSEKHRMRTKIFNQYFEAKSAA